MNGPIIFVTIFLSICAFFLIADIVTLFKQNFKLGKIAAYKFIDKLIVIFSVIAILITLLWDFNYLQYKSSIPYKDLNTITLNDFRGFKRPFFLLDGGTEFAYVSTSIDISKKHDEIQIVSLFHPCRSYVYNRNLYSNDLLTHELYHFHITEYCARKMRKEIKTQITKSQYVNLVEIENSILMQEQKIQYEYDDETYHGYVFGKQVEWQKKIDSSLLSLKKYSETIISLKK